MNKPVKYSCGHAGTINAVNPNCLSKNEELAISAAHKRLCPDCHQAECDERVLRVFGDRLPSFGRSEGQAEYAGKVFRRLLAAVSASPLAVRLVRQAELDPVPLLDAWNAAPHRNIPGPREPQIIWQVQILEAAYGKAFPSSPEDRERERAKKAATAVAIAKARGPKLIPRFQG